MKLTFYNKSMNSFFFNLISTCPEILNFRISIIGAAFPTYTGS